MWAKCKHLSLYTKITYYMGFLTLSDYAVICSQEKDGRKGCGNSITKKYNFLTT